MAPLYYKGYHDGGEDSSEDEYGRPQPRAGYGGMC